MCCLTDLAFRNYVGVLAVAECEPPG
jgi:hypothetical protein